MEENTRDENLKSVIDDVVSKIRIQSMTLGAQAMCQTIVQKIYTFESSYGKKTTNDYKRLIKDIKNFCEIGLSRKNNLDTTEESIDRSETEQN